MLPFDNRPWAKRLAAIVIVCTIVCEIWFYLWLRTEGPLNFSEKLAFVMFFLAVIPPNVHIIRSKKPIVEGNPRIPQGAVPVHK